MKLRQALAGAGGKNVHIVAVSPDTPALLAEMEAKITAKTGLEFTGIDLLSDAGHKVIDAYGLLNEAAAQRGRILPHPATYVLDAQGVVRWRYVEIDYRLRPGNPQVLAAIEEIRRRR